MRIALFLLAASATVLWAVGYAYVHAMACAWVTNPSASGCTVTMPWEHRSEDLLFLVILPGAIVTVLWGLFFLARRRKKKAPPLSKKPS